MTDLVDRSEEGVAALAHANYVEFGRETARWSGRGGEVLERGGAVLWAASSDFPVSMNGVVRIDPAAPAGEVLDLADAWFGERRRGYSLSTAGRFADDDLVADAEGRGLHRLLDAPAMVCDQRLEDGTAPDGVDVRIAATDDDVAAFVAVNDAAYQTLGMPEGVIAAAVTDPARVLGPQVRTAIAWEGGVPLACAQVLLSHGVAGVYYVGTAEAARGRGLAELVTRTVTNLGFDLGAAFVTLQASSMGEPIYRRMGYREIDRYTTHTRFV
ncbi:MAG TPA: hypothetical protein VNS19_12780 [Acidimicrobiales bacterium]|nr:hypothetical protein [Acidimicrobiales bacterium]